MLLTKAAHVSDEGGAPPDYAETQVPKRRASDTCSRVSALLLRRNQRDSEIGPKRGVRRS
jgi:hypothetical protein